MDSLVWTFEPISLIRLVFFSRIVSLAEQMLCHFESYGYGFVLAQEPEHEFVNYVAKYDAHMVVSV